MSTFDLFPRVAVPGVDLWDVAAESRGRLEDVEQNSGCSQWLYVGSPTQVAGQVDANSNLVTDLVAQNPPPYDESPWIPFLNGWNNSLGADAPLSFFVHNEVLHLRGAIGGGIANTIVFVLPVGFRPYYQQPIRTPAASAAHYASCLIAANGSVTYVQTV